MRRRDTSADGVPLVAGQPGRLSPAATLLGHHLRSAVHGDRTSPQRTLNEVIGLKRDELDPAGNNLAAVTWSRLTMTTLLRTMNRTS